jgi:hypothetical protein
MDIKEIRKRRAANEVTNWTELQEKRQKEPTVLQQEMDKDDSSKGSLSGRSRHNSALKGKVKLPHPPGYNKKKRDIVKLILVVVAAALIRGDPVVATVLSIVSIICLKEGTFWSTKNLKWMALCIMSCAMSSASWSLERDSQENHEEHVFFGKNSMFWTSAKVIQICWGMTLGVFLFSAYLHGHNSLLEFDFLYEAPLPPAGPRKDPPPKTYLIY